MLGAYYTDSAVARFLCEWAIREPNDEVLEPSFGEGAFLQAIIARKQELLDLEKRPNEIVQGITGVDLNENAWKTMKEAYPDARLVCSDFFEIGRGGLGFAHAVVGNPPFIRYHNFSGAARELALARAKQNSVFIPASASAWAPFLVHAASQLRSGGRLAMVAPYEITYAKYARPVVQFLARSFESIQVLTFEARLFPSLSQNTVLILCEGFGGSTEVIRVHSLRSMDCLNTKLNESMQVPVDEWVAGTARLQKVELSEAAADLYARLIGQPQVCRLGALVTLTIGYVTGDNDFFHLTRSEAKNWGLRNADLKRVVRRSADFSGCGLGLRVTDSRRLSESEDHLLFYPQDPLHSKSRAYIQLGELKEVHKGFKCRVRNPWYVVPGVKAPDLFVSVFASEGPKLVVNKARVCATNSVLIADLLPDMGVDPVTLAASAWTTFGQLSAELEGHALGGGALKFEPYEARQWALPCKVRVSQRAIRRLDTLLREGRPEEATVHADKVFLEQGMGLTQSEIEVLGEALRHLRRVRVRKGRDLLVHSSDIGGTPAS